LCRGAKTNVSRLSSTADFDLLANQQTSQATNDESNQEMVTFKRQLDKTSVGSVVDIGM